MAIDIITGLWNDYSKPAGSQATLTLKVDDANLLLSGLTFLVTIAAASFWQLTVLVLHHFHARKESPDHVDLQHRVVLRNSRSASSSIVSFFKIFVAWRRQGVPRIFRRSLGVILPAVVILVFFTAASVLVSRVANKSHAGTLARLQPDQCGFLMLAPEITGPQLVWKNSKFSNDTHAARQYVMEHYLSGGKNSPSSQSIFPQVTLPYQTTPNVACPFPNATRCLLGKNRAFSMTTGLIDSASTLGINAVPADRVSIKASMTCSPIDLDGLVERSYNVDEDKQPYLVLNMGSYMTKGKGQDTFNVFLEPSDTTQSYFLVQVSHETGQPDNAWNPIAEIKPTNADVNLFIMVRHRVRYASPVDDPWFSAHRPSEAQKNTFLPDNRLSVMGCTQQYQVCKGDGPNIVCSDPAGMGQANNTVFGTANPLGLTTVQKQTAAHIGTLFYNSRPEESVYRLREGALFANGLLNLFLSPGLPHDQWQNEVLGWFQTMLAQVQHTALQFVSKRDVAQGAGAWLLNPYDAKTAVGWTDAELAALKSICVNQLVRTTGQVQNFSFVGVMVIVGLSVLFILMDLCLELIGDWIQGFRRNPTAGMIARRADRNLHLLREKVVANSTDPEFEDDSWKDGWMGIPVRIRPKDPLNSPTLTEYGRGERYKSGLTFTTATTAVPEERPLRYSATVI